MRLLSNFLVLSRGDTGVVHGELDVLERGTPRGRDRLWLAALRAGAAGRDNDTAALGNVRGALRQAVAEHVRAARSFTEKVPKPTSATELPSFNEVVTAPVNASSARVAAALEISASVAIFSTN